MSSNVKLESPTIDSSSLTADFLFCLEEVERRVTGGGGFEGRGELWGGTQAHFLVLLPLLRKGEGRRGGGGGGRRGGRAKLK